MTEMEADALKMLSKTTEKAEELMEMEMREGALKTRERALGGATLLSHIKC